MRLDIARSAGAIAALAVGGTLLADTIELGTLQQIAPRPAYVYNGSYGAFISSSLVQNPQQRTLVAIDLYGLMQAAGLNWLESISIFDPGGNQYGGSPGADVDYFHLSGLPSAATMSWSYQGPNGTHLGESSQQLAARIASMDAVTGDQDYSVPHFVSLGLGGQLTMTFSTPFGGSPGGSGSGSGSGLGGGSGPGSIFGGGSPGETGSSPLIQVVPGMILWVSEAGFGESYGLRLTGLTIPAPGPLALLGLALGCIGGRRRARRERVSSTG